VARRGKRPRALRRERERELRRDVRERERLAELAPGGGPDRPIDVPSAAVVEVRAASTRCVLCGGELSVVEHRAERQGDDSLRAVAAACRQCHARRTLWFRLAPPLPN
jgi:hypothetical protein